MEYSSTAPHNLWGVQAVAGIELNKAETWEDDLAAGQLGSC